MKKKAKKQSVMRRLTACLLMLCMMLSGLSLDAFAGSDGISQTEYDTINDFQTARWTQIQSGVFEKKDGTPLEAGSYTGGELNAMLGTDGNGTHQVKAGNSCFNWVDRAALEEKGVAAWSGGSTEVLPRTEQETYEYRDTYTDFTGGQETEAESRVEIVYTVYDVGTAEELRWVMDQVASAAAGTHIKINLTNDINLNGEEQAWAPLHIANDRGWTYLEGNGHTIYNMRAHESGVYIGFFGYVLSPLIVKNLNFQSAMVLAGESNGYSYAGTLYGGAVNRITRVYLYNVHAREGYVYGTGSYVGGMTGMSNAYTFMKNCSNSDYYIYGTAHSGGFASWTANPREASAVVKYDSDFPEVPEAYFNSLVYTSIIEDCYSTDCTVFSVADAADSGGMFSCISGIVIRNCFTNNTMYGNSETGAFIGRINTNGYGYYDEAGNRTVGSYFENCYSAGLVEGEQNLGGFVGWNSNNGTVGGVFKNCYSTAMVGMDYGTLRLGGFAGYDGHGGTMELDIDGNRTTVYATAYISCYAAGEVGNILTVTDAGAGEAGATDGIGGFLGHARHKSGIPGGTFVNCYYDMQTTAMRERGYGRQKAINGVSGVYTLGSLKKGIKGLTYSSDAPSVDMGNNGVWSYEEGFYPQLQVFMDGSLKVETVTDDPCRYSVPISDWLVTEYDGGTVVTAEESLDIARTAGNYSKASVSTVFLNHWDTIMDPGTGAVAEENDWVCGVSQNRMTYDADRGAWSITYENVAAGTYPFKVQEGTSWSYNYGSDGFNGGNCELTLDETSDVTIYFSYSGSIIADGAKNTGYEIKADITPESSGITETVTLGTSELPDDQEWALTGTERLTGSNWDTGSLVMTDDGSGILTYTLEDVEGGYNYGYAVVPKGGTKDARTNHFFYLKSEAEGGKASYKLVFTYNSDTDETDMQVYESSASDVEITDTCLEEHPRASVTEGDGLIGFYTVAGDEALTGYNWLGQPEDSETYKSDAVSGGKMTYNPDTNRYEKTYYNVPVGTDGEIYTRSFKVVANGSWDYGIDYGDRGANYVLQLAAESGDYSECNVTIIFDPETEEVTVTTNPHSTVEVDESSFQWYIAGGYSLVSNDAYTSGKEVYDTVRDIVSGFTFTSGADMSWKVDEDRNKIEHFYGQFADGGSFAIPYTVDGKTVHGEFGGEVLNMVSEDAGGVTVYGVDSFMPGKSWVQVSYGTENDWVNGTVGSRRLRLIPTTYLEAGGNSDISVIYDEDMSSFLNEVRVLDVSSDDEKKQTFSYYNFALGAGYAVTDKVGLGIYGNYSTQDQQGYAAAQLRDDDDEATHRTDQYFSMYSAFHQSDSYVDDSTPQLDTLVDQALIGSSYGDAATIVKVYRANTGSDGTVTYSKVFVDSMESSSVYHDNYLKWTGQKSFEIKDAGEYRVTFYWLLSDGRYMSDSKSVRISYNSGNLEVSKSVTGSGGEIDRSFRFTVTLDDSSINGVYGDMGFNNGTATFTLRDGEDATALGLPTGTGYTVTETGADDYTTTITDEAGNCVSGKTVSGNISLGEEDMAAFVNHKDKAEDTPTVPVTPTTPETPANPATPDQQPSDPSPTVIKPARTGDTANILPMFLLLGASGITMIFVVYQFGRRQRCRG